jgi:predicted nucleic acid-binding protein
MPPNPNKIRIFADTSVIIAAVWSATGGARALFRMSELELIKLITGQSALVEADEVVRRKFPDTLPALVKILEKSRLEITVKPPEKLITKANEMIAYPPDAKILAEAMQAAPDWFVTHDRQHFLNNPALRELSFRTGTPGDVLLWLKETA